MLLVSINERSSVEPNNYSTVKNISELYRGLCAGLDVQKFLSMSNFDLFFCQFEVDYSKLLETGQYDATVFNPVVENLADSVYEYMSENLDVYFDIVKSIDEYRAKIKSYKLDK